MKLTPTIYQDPVWWAWLEVFFTSKIFHFQNMKLSTLIFFRLSALKGTGKALAVDPARLNAVRKLPFLTPKGMVSTLSVSFMGFPLGVNFEFMVS